MNEWLMVYVLPILQSILAGKMDAAADEWAQISDSSDKGKFCLIMKKAFISAVKKVKGDSPKIVKDNLDELFDDCRILALEEIRLLNPVKVKAYFETDLFNAFKAELLNTEEAIPYINKTLLEEILKNNKSFINFVEKIERKTDDIQKVASEILSISKKLISGKGVSACRIIPYVEGVPIEIPKVCAHREKLIFELKEQLLDNKCIVLYAGVKEGKTIASRLLAMMLQPQYSIIEIDLEYRNDLDLEYILNSYNVNSKCLFVLDGVKADNKCYEAFCSLIHHNFNDNWLFVINCYDKMSESIFDDSFLLTEYSLPALTLDDIKEIIPQDKWETFAELVWNLYGGQPLLTNLLCSYLCQKSWELTPSELLDISKFTRENSFEKKITHLLRKTVCNDDAYNLLNRLMTVSRPFTASQCAELANINPILRNPNKLLDELEGMWVVENDGVYTVSNLLSKSIYPDLLPQEIKDCYHYEAIRLMKDQKLTPLSAMAIWSCYIKACDYDLAGSFYILLLSKLQEQKLLQSQEVAIIKAIWVGASLPQEMSNQMKLAVRSCQLVILNDLNKQIVDSIIDEIANLCECEYIDKSLRNVSLQMLAAYCSIYGNNDRAIGFQQKILMSSDCDLESFDLKATSLVSLNNVKNCHDLCKWFALYSNMQCPQDDMYSEGAIVCVNRLYDECDEDGRENLLKEVLNQALSNHINLFAIACGARLIDYYWQNNRAEEARAIFEKLKYLLSLGFGEILLNYSHGLGLYHHGFEEEALPFLERAAKGKHINTACMVSLNARCAYAQILGDNGDKMGAALIVRELVCYPLFSQIFGAWEQDAALCSLAYSLWEVGKNEDAVALLLKVEHHLWEERNNKNADFINLSLRFVILVSYIHASSKGTKVNPQFFIPDYSLFVKEIPGLDKEYKPERNFTVEELLYELVEIYIGTDDALTILVHMTDFQREDAAKWAKLLSVMVQAVPLCLNKKREDIIEYIVLTVLAAPNKKADEQMSNNDNLTFWGSLQLIVAYRTVCLIDKIEFDDNWLFGMMERAIGFLESPKEAQNMMEQMQSLTPNFDIVKESLCEEIVYLFHFHKVEFSRQIALLWRSITIMSPLVNMPSAQQFVKHFVLTYAKYLVTLYPSRFDISPNSIDSYFLKIMNYEGIYFAKKVVQGLYFNVKGDILETEDMRDFFYD